MKKIIAVFIISLIFTFHGFTQFRLSPDDSIRRDSINKVTQRDYNQMLGQLHITAIRQGANGNDPRAPNAANYDEAKANPYPDLPDALILKNARLNGAVGQGKKIADA